MKPKISIITLGVANLETARKFYEEGLGLKPQSETSKNIAFYDMNGTLLSLYPREKLAEDVGVSADTISFSGVTIAHNEPGREGVNKVIEEARNAGATIVKEPQDAFWGGYSGYFQDLDGHLWEVAHNPFKDLT